RQAENFRKMFLAMAKDVRIIFLKLADRLHNMRTLNYMAEHKQKRIAEETLEIFAPLANRLGIGKIKAELEDLALRYTNPEKYYRIAQLVAQNKAERDLTVNAIIDKIQANLKNLNIQATITGRAKHYYSIFNKMERQNKTFQELYDITAVRVLVGTEKECYEVLGIIHSAFKPIPGRFKDYIAMPKSNLYRSLHTSVIGPRGKPLEVQIRTNEMHEIAEYGIAAHWKYKEGGSKNAGNNFDKKLTWLRKLAEMQQDVTDAQEYVDQVKYDIFSDQVFVFTPMGDVFDLPNGAIPIDFAYRVHTEVGHKTTGALINGRIATLDTKLKNGDIVEVITGKTSQPKYDWIHIVVTNQAKSKIKHWFKKNNKEQHTQQGKNMLEEHLGKSSFEEYFKSGHLLEVAQEMNYQSEEDLFAALGYGEATLHRVKNKLKTEIKTEDEEAQIRQIRPSKRPQKGIIGLEGMLYHIAKCCAPVPGEEIIGVITRSRGVSVHKSDCNSLDVVEPQRLMNIRWATSEGGKKYVTNLRIEAYDRLGALKDILGKVADCNTNLVSASVRKKNKKEAIVDIGVEISDIQNLNRVIKSIQTIPDVIIVRRQHIGNT
ncbi:MAG: bifunctional (p)ppGpp synthetase/guanosine-3',5'-bis(diphosphate) 3'-pyrophosphohydrolase, partial [Candidatus Gastranaerophilales bacterium]|nr:bifunctional (p)ppGpp synthetase/guanosine-3',5'-bis(diphosphate) 3'-pyrophosphohydrolase [Candidatus Gastranaerophilales bacterium]